MRHEPPLVADIPSAVPAEPGATPADPYVAPVQETLAKARDRAAGRRARWAAAQTHAQVLPPAPKRSISEAPVPPARGRILKCRVCGKAEPRSAGDIRRLARGAWPMCCGQVMPPVLEPSAEPCSAEDADDLPWADRRVNDRRKARAGSRAEVRRGLLGMSPDLALKLVDVSEGGVQVRLVAAVRPGEQVEVALWPPARGKSVGAGQSVRGPAVVCWCLPTPTGEFRAGLRLRRRLAADLVNLLAE